MTRKSVELILEVEDSITYFKDIKRSDRFILRHIYLKWMEGRIKDLDLIEDYTFFRSEFTELAPLAEVHVLRTFYGQQPQPKPTDAVLGGQHIWKKLQADK